MREFNDNLKPKIEKGILPVHSLDTDSMQINILPLDHSNPYDYKREHRHTYYEIMLIENGGCNQIIDFTNYEGVDHSCYLICPQQVHLMNRKNSAGSIIQFTEDRISSPEIRAGLGQLLFYDNSSIIFENRPDLFNELQLLLNILEKYLATNESASPLVISSLLQGFISLILEHKRRIDNSEKRIKRKLLVDFYVLLELHYSEGLGVQFFIDKLGTTEKKLANITKVNLGMSPLQVIHNRILLEAKRLLLFEETSNKEIAYQLGFDSPSSFSAFIKSKTGLSPIELIKQLSEIHK